MKGIAIILSDAASRAFKPEDMEALQAYGEACYQAGVAAAGDIRDGWDGLDAATAEQARASKRWECAMTLLRAGYWQVFASARVMVPLEDRGAGLWAAVDAILDAEQPAADPPRFQDSDVAKVDWNCRADPAVLSPSTMKEGLTWQDTSVDPPVLRTWRNGAWDPTKG